MIPTRKNTVSDNQSEDPFVANMPRAANPHVNPRMNSALAIMLRIGKPSSTFEAIRRFKILNVFPEQSRKTKSSLMSFKLPLQLAVC